MNIRAVDQSENQSEERQNFRVSLRVECELRCFLGTKNCLDSISEAVYAL